MGTNVIGYTVRRVLIGIPVLLGLTIVMFGLVHLAPGDPVDAFISPGLATPQMIAQMRHNFGLDKPLPVQYLIYLGNLLHGNLGTAYSFNGQTVWHLIKTHAGATIELQVISLVLALLISIPLGILSALKQYSLLDNTTTVGAFIGWALPNFWLALLLQFWLSVQLHWLPAISTGQSSVPFPERIKYFIMPVIVLAFPSVAYFARFMRSAMLEIKHQDYMTTARAKGLQERIVITRHALRNAFIPMVTTIGLQVAHILSGAVIIEQIYAWPGLGQLAYMAILQRDYPVILGVTTIAGAFVIVVNIIVDILYVVVDPRVSLAG
ncbi:MAG TPA: ABC transporter permease [Thermomicrobiaceae bacterium]|nr:ABC transporter permease [Thermomicrobiaceae bacterium]